MMKRALVVIFEIILTKILASYHTGSAHAFHPSHFESGTLGFLLTKEMFFPPVKSAVDKRLVI